MKDNSRDKIIQIGKMLNEMNSYMRVEGHTDNMSIKIQSLSQIGIYQL